MFSAYNLSIGYNKGTSREKILHEGLSFSLEKGTLTCLIGPNGAGKSTLLRTLSGNQSPLKGRLEFNGKDMSAISGKELAKEIGLVLTDRTFAGGLTVKELVSLGRYPYTGFWGKLDDSDERTVHLVMERTGILDKASRYVSELSDGERQKVMIAKALAQECPVIILDEPTAFLDITSKMDIMYLLHEMTSAGKTVLLSTHDIDQVLQLADRIWIMEKDRGITSGTPEELALNGDIDRVFGNGTSSFDICSGRFFKQPKSSARFSIEAEEETKHWIENILRRYDIGICGEYRSVPGIHGSSDADACIKAKNGEIRLESTKGTISFPGLREFSEYIRKNCN